MHIIEVVFSYDPIRNETVMIKEKYDVTIDLEIIHIIFQIVLLCISHNVLKYM